MYTSMIAVQNYTPCSTSTSAALQLHHGAHTGYMYSVELTVFFPLLSTATTELVQKYEQHCHHFMAGTTVSQFKALFPVSATPSKLSNSKTSIILKLKKEWDKETLEDLANLVDLFGEPGIDLHLSKVRQGCIAVTWLCSTDDVKNLRTAISDVADSLQTKGVLQILVEEEIIWECSQPEQGDNCIPYMYGTCNLKMFPKVECQPANKVAYGFWYVL